MTKYLPRGETRGRIGSGHASGVQLARPDRNRYLFASASSIDVLQIVLRLDIVQQATRVDARLLRFTPHHHGYPLATRSDAMLAEVEEFAIHAVHPDLDQIAHRNIRH